MKDDELQRYNLMPNWMNYVVIKQKIDHLIIDKDDISTCERIGIGNWKNMASQQI